MYIWLWRREPISLEWKGREDLGAAEEHVEGTENAASMAHVTA